MASRIGTFQSRLRREGLDGFVVLHPFNLNYLSGFSGTSGALVTSQRKALFLTDSRYTVQAKTQVKDAQVVLQTKALLADAAGLVKQLAIRKLGFEALHVPFAAYEYLKKALPGVQLVPTKNLAESQREIKDPGEMAKMRMAARITDQCISHIRKFIKPGVTENAVAAEMEAFMRRQGASGVSFETIVASGWRSALPHGVASDKKIEKGDMIVIDFGCMYQGYASDMTRCVVVGKPSPLQRKIYEIVKKSQAAGLKKIKAGTSCGDVDKASRSIISKAGYAKNFGHGLGHGVGVEVHEEPRLGPKNPAKLVAGQAVTCEPGIYLEGKFGVRIEDLVLVTKTGHENLYRATKELVIV